MRTNIAAIASTIPSSPPAMNCARSGFAAKASMTVWVSAP